jgi:hypothetical protein
MFEPAFFDTNLVLCAYSLAQEDQSKREIARHLMELHSIVLSNAKLANHTKGRPGQRIGDQKQEIRDRRSRQTFA